jgi:dolichol-phosphate mannosyltransferase
MIASESGDPSPVDSGQRSLTLSVVAPCFNEEEVLPELHRRVTRACEEVVDGDYELILVNDGSRDQTWSLISSLAESDSHIVGVNLAHNHGHQLALTAGLSLCRGRRILIIDADLQDPPELLGEMMRLMDAGADVVYGQRSERRGESWLKQTSASLFYSLLSRLTEVPVPVDTGDFRLISARVLKALQSMPEQHRFIRGMIAWIGFKQVPLHYERDARFAGATKYPLRKMVSFALDAITGFSTQPLRISFYMGAFSLLVASLLIVYVLYSWLFLGAVRGWASVLIILLLFGSAQLWSLGILGEYLGRAYMQTKQRPLFIISEIVVTERDAANGDAGS